METIVVSAGTRSLFTREEILALLRDVISSNEHEREHIIGSLLEHCVFRERDEAVLARDTMRFFFWHKLEQYKLDRVSEEEFVELAYPVFVRFCEGVPRECTQEDTKILRLINSVLYTADRDPLARTLHA